MSLIPNRCRYILLINLPIIFVHCVISIRIPKSLSSLYLSLLAIVGIENTMTLSPVKCQWENGTRNGGEWQAKVNMARNVGAPIQIIIISLRVVCLRSLFCEYGTVELDWCDSWWWCSSSFRWKMIIASHCNVSHWKCERMLLGCRNVKYCLRASLSLSLCAYVCGCVRGWVWWTAIKNDSQFRFNSGMNVTYARHSFQSAFLFM